jgi:hypothetical protein
MAEQDRPASAPQSAEDTATITTEWAVFWPATGDAEQRDDEQDARRVARMYNDGSDEAPQVVCHTVTRSPWKAA